MINLLPSDKKRQLQAAKTNTILLRYNIWLGGAVGVMILAFVSVYAILGIGQKAAEDNIAANQAKVASYAQVRQDGQKFSQNLAIAEKIFANQITYSDLIVQIAQTIPAGASLQNLTLSTASFGTGTQLIFNVNSPQTALAVKDTLAANTKLFSNVYLESITTQEGNNRYPYIATLSVVINKQAVQQ